MTQMTDDLLMDLAENDEQLYGLLKEARDLYAWPIQKAVVLGRAARLAYPLKGRAAKQLVSLLTQGIALPQKAWQREKELLTKEELDFFLDYIQACLLTWDQELQEAELEEFSLDFSLLCEKRDDIASLVVILRSREMWGDSLKGHFWENTPSLLRDLDERTTFLVKEVSTEDSLKVKESKLLQRAKHHDPFCWWVLP